ncbi:MAG: ASKHA domain-containing protein [Clostridiales bacterium]|nr:ASKHA domain-containing protein [Clostridiales bacterium]MCF8022327.1 ASKHA domain-containing protein [Clostridiales bacterium]
MNDIERIKLIGNAAGEGSQMTLVSDEEKQRAQEISKKVKYVELSTHKGFKEEFMKAMAFS